MEGVAEDVQGAWKTVVVRDVHEGGADVEKGSGKYLWCHGR